MSFSSAREKAGMTQNEVANALGVNQSSVSLWESGRNLPRGKQMVKLAKLYGVTVDELLREEDTNAKG